MRSKDLGRRQEWTSSWSTHLEGNWDLKDVGDRKVDGKLLLATFEITRPDLVERFVLWGPREEDEGAHLGRSVLHPFLLWRDGPAGYHGFSCAVPFKLVAL